MRRENRSVEESQSCFAAARRGQRSEHAANTRRLARAQWHHIQIGPP
jgi:hypothetical protein